MKILLTGAASQLGHALRQEVPAGVELIATSRRELALAVDGGVPRAFAQPLPARAASRPASGQGVILRTSWVMGSVGKNFELTMLRLLIGVVADQVCGSCLGRGRAGRQVGRDRPGRLMWS
jgi:dTDP-4-dehydrorhamnose reductase